MRSAVFALLQGAIRSLRSIAPTPEMVVQAQI